MNIERLNLLVTMLRQVEAKTWRPTFLGVDEDADVRFTAQEVPEVYGLGFNLGYWLNSDEPATAVITVPTASGHCGFAACAIGHAMLDHRFNEQGLEARCDAPYYCVPEAMSTAEGELLKKGEELYTFDAVGAFFDITVGEAVKLFTPGSYPAAARTTPGQVADAVQCFIDKEQGL